MNLSEIILYPLMTEKCLDLADKENKLVFIVRITANKQQIKQAVEKIYNVKVSNVNTQITMKGQKKSIIQLTAEHSASDIASRMGVF